MSNDNQRDDYRPYGGRPPRGGPGGPGGHGGGYGGGPRERRGVPLSELDPTTTEASRKVIGAAIEVHRALGPGFPREVYANALKVELDALGVKHETGRKIPVRYKDKPIGEITTDLYVENRFIVTVMGVAGMVGTPERLALRAQLKAADFELGLIINFGDRRLKDGLVRVVNIDKIRAEKGLGEGDDFDDAGSTHDFEN
ncbi:MAG: GxxExxY protein [Planctomycetota bacterium]|nr:GxxExxY protein [Planctomycetota bacterium]